MSQYNIPPQHLWQCEQSKQQACWCTPLMLEGLAFHRPWPGFVFWDKKGSGPQLTPEDTIDFPKQS